MAVLAPRGSLGLLRRRWPASTVAAAADNVCHSPLRNEAAWYDNWLILRRALLALAFALFQNDDLRAMSVRTVLVTSPAPHMQLASFASAAVNRLEAIALLALVIASSLQQMESSFEAVAIL